MSDEASTVLPFRAVIRCNNKDDDHVLAFTELYTEKQLPYEVIVEERGDIDVSLYDVLDTKIDQFGLLHKG